MSIDAEDIVRIHLEELAEKCEKIGAERVENSELRSDRNSLTIKLQKSEQNLEWVKYRETKLKFIVSNALHFAESNAVTRVNFRELVIEILKGEQSS